MQALARRINKELDLIKFDSLFSGFERPRFALYNDGYLYYPDKIMPYKKEKNVTIIGELDLDSPLAINVSMVVKQMFLDFLSSHYQMHFPNYLKILDYPFNYLNIDYMCYEKNLLLKGFLTKDLNEKLNYLRMFMNVRHIRKDLIDDYIKEEYKNETINGLCEFIFYKVLKQLSPRLAHQYINEEIHSIKIYSRDFFDLYHQNHFVGCMLMMMLEDLKIRFSAFDLKNRTIFETILGKVEYIEEMISYIPTEGLIANIKRYNNEIKECFIDFFAYKTKKTSGEFKIIGFDPFRMIKNDNQIYHQNFVKIQDKYGKIYFINGPVITRGNDDVVTCYFERID